MLKSIQNKLLYKILHNLKSRDLKPIKKNFKLITKRNFYLKISLLILIKSQNLVNNLYFIKVIINNKIDMFFYILNLNINIFFYLVII